MAGIRSYGRWIVFLAGRCWLDDEENPPQRARTERLPAYLEHLRMQALSEITIAGLFRDLHEALRVMAPGSDLTVLKRAITVLSANSKPSRDKTLKYVRPQDALTTAVAHLEAIAKGVRGRRDAARARCALQLVFLITRPLRRANFAGLRIGHEIVRLGPGRWRITLPGRATKNKRPYEVMLPDRVGAWLDVYLERWRPMLLGTRTSDRLWITHMGTDMTSDGVYDEIVTLTERLFGHALNPHAFRNGPATALAIEDASHVAAAGPLLGHNGPRTSEAHYNLARTVEAADAWQETIRRRRRVLAREQRRPDRNTRRGSR